MVNLDLARGPDESAIDGVTPAPDDVVIGADEYADITGESLGATLDINNWHTGVSALAFERLEREIADAERLSDDLRRTIRDKIFGLIDSPTAPPGAGVYRASIGEVRAAQTDVLFNGLVEAVDATSFVFHTLPLQIIQIAVAAVTYNGEEQTWANRIFRRDIPIRGGPSVIDETIELLRRRADGSDAGGGRRKVTDMMRRGVMTFMERVVLSHKATAPWRLGHGNPLAYELLTGSGMRELIEYSIPVLDRLVLQHKKFVFVPSVTTKEHFLTIGDALEPLEYAITDNAAGDLRKITGGNYRGEWQPVLERDLKPFCDEVGPLVMTGVYRASMMAPARMFYAHRDHVHEAALVAIADSIMQEHRGFPMLVDMADGICRTYFGAETLNRPSTTALTNTGQPYRYLDERATRA
jgi:hypothetical protein